MVLERWREWVVSKLGMHSALPETTVMMAKFVRKEVYQGWGVKKLTDSNDMRVSYLLDWPKFQRRIFYPCWRSVSDLEVVWRSQGHTEPTWGGKSLGIEVGWSPVQKRQDSFMGKIEQTLHRLMVYRMCFPRWPK